MSDSLSSYPSGQLSVQSNPDRYALLHERVVSCLTLLQHSGFSTTASDQINTELSAVSSALVSRECGHLLVMELIKSNRIVASRADHRNVEVLRYGLQQLADYLGALQVNETDSVSALLLALNELAAMDKLILVSQSMLSVPDVYRVNIEALRVDENKQLLENCYLEFSQLLLGIQRGDERQEKLNKLSEFFIHLGSRADSDKPQSFWLACGTFLKTIDQPAGELRPAVFEVLKQIEKVVIDALGDGRHVLGIQAVLDQLLCNLLCYIYCGDRADVADEELQALNKTFGFESTLQEVDQLRDRIDENDSAWVESSVGNLLQRLRHNMQRVTDDSYAPVDEFFAEVLNLRKALVLSGVHGAGDNIQDAVDRLRQDKNTDTIHSATVSFELVEQQMMYQFGLVGNSAYDTPEPAAVASVTEPHVTEPVVNESLVGEPFVTKQSVTVELPDADFVVRCNSCIDVIQHALDTALGSSGNLIPDNSVVSAVNKLNNIATEENVEPLTALLSPLTQFLTDAENSTLNQAETLLVQEAIIAATLGIDSIVSKNPMPELIVEVTQRIEIAAEDSNFRSDAQLNNSFNDFLNEASELQPRLFELFQRWRGAPDGASRLSGDISRLLHALKQSAEDVDQSLLASLTHYLESSMIDLRDTDERPSQAFFDLAIETVESLGDDIERLRNNEALDNHDDLIDRLKLTVAVVSDSSESITAEKPVVTANLLESAVATDGGALETDVEKDSRPVVFDRDLKADLSTDWHKRIERIDACYEQLSHHNTQLTALQQQLDTAAQNIRGKVDQAVQSELLLAVDSLRQLGLRQSASIEQLDNDLNSVSAHAAESLVDGLIDAIAHSAKDSGLQVRFKFTNHAALPDRKMLSLIHQCLEPLLQSIVCESIEDATERTELNKPDLASVEVCIEDTPEGLIIEVIDDGSGVQVSSDHSANPWEQASRARYSNSPSHQSADKRPRGSGVSSAVTSRLTGNPVDISSLTGFAARYGGTVSIDSDEAGTCYRVLTPRLIEVQDVLLLEVERQKFAIATDKVVKVALWEGEKALSIAQLIGMTKKSAFEKKDTSIAVQCRAGMGLHSLLADRVLGHHSQPITDAGRIIPSTLPGYSGSFITAEGEAVLVLDVDYWLTQGRSARYF